MFIQRSYIMFAEPSGLLELKFYDSNEDVLFFAPEAKQKEVFQNEYNTCLFGIELEFNMPTCQFKDLFPLLDIGMFKQDDSVDGEFVTFPYTWEDLQTNLSEKANLLDTLLSNNAIQDKPVGMHVHVTRAAYPDQLWLNLARYILENATAIQQLAGRGANEYCQYMFGGLCPKHSTYSVERNVALNLSNMDTVEFRMFRSPCDTKGVLSNLTILKSWLDNITTHPQAHFVNKFRNQYTGYLSTDSIDDFYKDCGYILDVSMVWTKYEQGLIVDNYWQEYAPAIPLVDRDYYI